MSWSYWQCEKKAKNVCIELETVEILSLPIFDSAGFWS